MSDEEVVRSDEEGEKEETEAPAEEAPAEEAEAGQEEAAEAEETPQPTSDVEEESKEEETPKSPIKRADEGPSEAELAMQKRRQQLNLKTDGLDEQTIELLEAARKEREREEEEIRLLREKREKRKREREEEERLLAERRAEEEARRKAEEEERRRKKQEEEERKKQERAKKMAEFEKWRNPTSPNFVITRKDRPAGSAGGEEETAAVQEGVEGGEKKSKEQLEAEKRAILKQRIQPLEIDGFDTAKLAEKARELHAQVYRLESEKYDLERRFKSQLGDMLELAERARNMNKVGKHGSIRRVQLSDGESDKFQERFAGCPARIVMYSEYERQKDKRGFKQRRALFTGPIYGYPPERIKPSKIVRWNEEGQPIYETTGEEEQQQPQEAEATA